MKKVLRLPLALLVCGLISACGLNGGQRQRRPDACAQAAPAAKANAFNPWMNKSLPNTRTLSAEGMAMVQAMGADRQSIEDEAAYRPHWREEIYPVFFGNRRPRTSSSCCWTLPRPTAPVSGRPCAMPRPSSRPLTPRSPFLPKIRRTYGTDLMGMGIWISYERKGQAMDYHEATPSANGTASRPPRRSRGAACPSPTSTTPRSKPTDLPIHYAYMAKLRPAVPSSQELDVARYCYNAGNVNMYQAVQISRYYGVKRIPAVIADGKVLVLAFGHGHRIRLR